MIHSATSTRCHFASGARPKSSSSKVVDDGTAADDRYSQSMVTDEGVVVHQRNPSTVLSVPGLTWGSVLWPSIPFKP